MPISFMDLIGSCMHTQQCETQDEIVWNTIQDKMACSCSFFT